MISKVQVPTPERIVNQVLDYAGYTNELYGKTVLENSCGEGNFLAQIVERYIYDCEINDLSREDTKAGLERDIVAYEVDEKKIDICIHRLDSIGKRYNIESVNWNIKKQDFLKAELQEKFDFIIGNPPYCTYHDLSDEERNFLRENFETCQNGRFDYFYAFVEKSLNALNASGGLFYLVPFSLYRNKSAKALRRKLINKLRLVIDYSGINVFEKVTVSSTLIGYQKGLDTEYFEYRRPSEKVVKQVQKEALGDIWIFETKPKTKRFRFGDYYTVNNSVATQCNEAFLLNVTNEDRDYVYTDKGERLERALIKKAVSVRSSDKKLRIIYPYLYHSGKVKHFSNEDFEEKYPCISSHLMKYKDKLDGRDSAKSAKWFEYGRSQGLQHVGSKNLVMSMIITNRVKIIEADKDVVPYAGYVITAISRYDLDIAKKILESADFLNYVKEHGTPTTKTSYRISAKEIENYTVDNI